MPKNLKPKRINPKSPWIPDVDIETLSENRMSYRDYSCLSKEIKSYIMYKEFLSNCQKTTQIKSDDIVVRRSNSNNQLETDGYGSTLRWRVDAVVHGMVIGRRILLNGLGRPELINSPEAHEHSVHIDPQYIDSIILGDRYYDPRKEMVETAKLKQQAYKHNKSISKKITTFESATEFLSSLKVGDRFRTSNTFVGLSLSSYHNHWEVVDILNEEHTIIVVVSEVGVPYTSLDLSPNNLTSCIATSKEPFPLESVIKKQKTF